jgi:uncharacterized membrane protein YjfL (UPF0719 family)
MSGGEVLLLIAGTGLGLVLWGAWLLQLSRARRSSRLAHRWPLLLVPAVCGAVLFGILKTWAASDVRDAPEYLYLYFAVGAAWVGLGAFLLPYFGLSARDDVIERANSAAAYAVGGALLGLTFCYAGGNIGDGPGWWVVLFCAALATGGMLLLWTFLNLTTGLADTVTIDRDPAAGVRLAGFLAGTGLILGRAVAGDWTSVDAAIHDFLRVGWPAAGLWLLAVFVERGLRPRPGRPAGSVVTEGFGPFVLYLGIALYIVWRAGTWS